MDRPDVGAQRRRVLARVRRGTVGLVGASGGLLALYADGSLLQIAAAVVAGLVVGALLVWLALPSPEQVSPGGRRGGR
jgi:hypothetical protein